MTINFFVNPTHSVPIKFREIIKIKNDPTMFRKAIHNP